ncbi:putative ubiquitin-protein ligase [Emiliania huxleyi CCMP1516]|uniref:HECT-type E3 ubiquitin transferase n=2 Tax=Emiliania huxleyi TaxID=2903 RepID=A0A0D3IGS9_EMIH1|nr:putative ubiquitin-protein ligase [Emiliania huxleyi CCMP1516]EOD10464.1 putative ubiquitin-protein ligase [Emiliania huxleyi CCMP1516]|eukprot:XP_005762893.1 putative ubiquitin-protein ligase [Emiliania huxleyi CCMP1516]
MQVAYEEFGERKVFDLVEGGGEVPVRAFFVLGANRAEYVRLYTQYLLVDSVATQSDAFLRGFESAIQLFRWEELELLLCGSPNLDFEALERVTQYDDGFSCDSPCIALLWEVIHELPLEMKKKFLFFCTGSDRVPIKGLGNLSFVISRNGSDEERLPSAHTCFNHLLQPPAAARVHDKVQAQGAAAQGGLGHRGLPHHLTAGPRPQSSSRGGGERAAVRERPDTKERSPALERGPTGKSSFVEYSVLSVTPPSTNLCQRRLHRRPYAACRAETRM